jgi:shikimate dehydrogenase
VKRLAVLGHPVGHSRSPAMQNAALEALGLDEWRYEAIEVTPEEFAARTQGLAGEGFVGVNVTIPHKVAALAIADDASSAASEIGAANTLSFTAEGIRAYNTDASGLIAALPGPPSGLNALVLGAGGSARAAVWALARQGARVAVWNRTAERAEALVRELQDVATDAAGELRAVDTEQARGPGQELIVNCTAAGMPGDPVDVFQALPIDPDRLGAEVTLVDLVYGGTDTELVREARSRGAIVVEGLEVLVRQGAESLRIWTGLEPPLEVMREAARAG